ncbi:hypothetical protein F5884DRAFT_849146 [Xylogone sp. PMI_703]|nr:hypothetical protein F5884DRAFT_849146 [Xylogone sp. PMI_703]
MTTLSIGSNGLSQSAKYVSLQIEKFFPTAKAVFQELKNDPRLLVSFPQHKPIPKSIPTSDITYYIATTAIVFGSIWIALATCRPFYRLGVNIINLILIFAITLSKWAFFAAGFAGIFLAVWKTFINGKIEVGADSITITIRI